MSYLVGVLARSNQSTLALPGSRVEAEPSKSYVDVREPPGHETPYAARDCLVTYIGETGQIALAVRGSRSGAGQGRSDSAAAELASAVLAANADP